MKRCEWETPSNGVNERKDWDGKEMGRRPFRRRRVEYTRDDPTRRMMHKEKHGGRIQYKELDRLGADEE